MPGAALLNFDSNNHTVFENALVGLASMPKVGPLPMNSA
jgi:hypothetical protein